MNYSRVLLIGRIVLCLYLPDMYSSIPGYTVPVHYSMAPCKNHAAQPTEFSRVLKIIIFKQYLLIIPGINNIAHEICYEKRQALELRLSYIEPSSF